MRNGLIAEANMLEPIDAILSIAALAVSLWFGRELTRGDHTLQVSAAHDGLEIDV